MRKNEMTTTENGDLTHLSSANDFVDLFFNMGAARNNDSMLNAPFTRALETDIGLTGRMLLWARDARTGAGERKIFRKYGQTFVLKLKNDQAKRFIHKIPEVGRWDDVWKMFYGTPHQNLAFSIYAEALRNGDGLAAKWAPREKSANRKVAQALANYMNVSRRHYRKMLVDLTNVVETQMCNREFKSIEFGKVPSQAINIYRKSFARQAPVQWENYIGRVESGTEKINAGAIFPYQLIKMKSGGYYTIERSQEQQWKALPDFTNGKEGSIIPVVDVSGSMGCSAGGSKTTCMDVAVSLGLYLSERLKGPFQDSFITFSSSPKVQVLKGSLNERLKQLSKANWSMSTNLDAVFGSILNAAVKGNVSQDDMPRTVLILSDMQFNQAIRSGTAQDRIEEMYHKHGYNVPNVVYWNIRATGTSPVTFDKSNTALVSGFSPSIVKSILGSESMTPTAIMMKTLMDPLYTW